MASVEEPSPVKPARRSGKETDRKNAASRSNRQRNRRVIPGGRTRRVHINELHCTTFRKLAERKESTPERLATNYTN